MLQLNGKTVKAPSSFQVILSDLDADSTRNLNGELIRDRIGVKRKIEVEWSTLSPAECSAILSAVQDVFFPVTYPDPLSGKMDTRTMYVGDRTAPMLHYWGGVPRWESLKMNFIEK